AIASKRQVRRSTRCVASSLATLCSICKFSERICASTLHLVYRWSSLLKICFLLISRHGRHDSGEDLAVLCQVLFGGGDPRLPFSQPKCDSASLDRLCEVERTQRRRGR